MDSLHIYNTLAREKQPFVPLNPGEVRMYVCGITVYDYCHLGHARVMVVFDIVRQWLSTLGYRVIYVRNITDIDDKIIQRSLKNGETIAALTERFIQAMHEDADALGIQRPDREPRATKFMPQMLHMIESLEKNGYAYLATNGDMKYAIRKFAGYGKLSGRSLKDLKDLSADEDEGEGEIESTKINEAKEEALDFVLWKRAKPEEPADALWDSKWGKGRPGWHIECSAMACTLLGERLDIHGGGQDLEFPHHENEIAQSEAAHRNGHPFVNYWMHNGYVQIDVQKMSKSSGNFSTIRTVLEKFDPEVLRFFLLRAHYRSPLNYSHAHLEDAQHALTRLYTALKSTAPDDAPLDWAQSHAQRFRSAMNDDFNTPVAVAVLFELASEVNKNHNRSLARQLKGLAAILGLLGRDPCAFLQTPMGGATGVIGAIGAIGGENVATKTAAVLSAEAIEAHIAERNRARREKHYLKADQIRAELLKAGVLLEDGVDDITQWRRI